MKYKNYTVYSPYDKDIVEKTQDYITPLSEETESKFAAVDPMNGLKKNTWQPYKHTVTLSENVFGDDDPEFAMYYINAAGDRIKVTVQAKAAEGNVYKLRFKTPNANGNFPVQIHYVTNGEESLEYISTTMNVTK